MTAAAPPVPAFGTLAAALRRTTERLAAELVRPTDVEPDWSETEWSIACSVAAMQGISALLANRLRWLGPPLWQAFLAEQRKQSLLRDARIAALLEQLDGAMRERQIACIALKGAALRALDLYRPGERPMGDVDLLVAARDMPAIASALAGIGYDEAYATKRHVVYAARCKVAPHWLGEHADNPLKIELHTAVTEELPVRSVDITDRLRRGPARAGLNTYPDLPTLLLHLLLHAAGNMLGHTLRQIQLHDIAAVGQLLWEEDWQALLERERGEERLWWAFPPLALTGRYYPEAVPAAVLRAARALCPRVLRIATDRQRLTQVSLSNLRIHALPGIAWSRTPLEALRFIRSRVLPSRRALAEIDAARPVEPQLDAVPWYGLSHGRRILRWLFSQPPRVQTMVSVKAALESAGKSARNASR